MSYRGTGRAFVDTQSPEAFGVCDRCGTWRNRSDLTWQYDYRGNALQNLRILVCAETSRCNDIPQEQLRPVIIPPDPLTIKDPRPENFASVYAPSSTQVIITDGGTNVLTNTAGQPQWLAED